MTVMMFFLINYWLLPLMAGLTQGLHDKTSDRMISLQTESVLQRSELLAMVNTKLKENMDLRDRLNRLLQSVSSLKETHMSLGRQYMEVLQENLNLLEAYHKLSENHGSLRKQY